MVEYLTKEGAIVTITDINEERLYEVAKKYGATIFAGDDFYSADVDIYAPCALGATINDDTINRIKAKVIAGAANNQLAVEQVHCKNLKCSIVNILGSAHRFFFTVACNFAIHINNTTSIYQEIRSVRNTFFHQYFTVADQATHLL